MPGGGEPRLPSVSTGTESLSQAELLNDGTVTHDVLLLQIVQHVSALTDHFLKAATGMEILGVGFQMLGEVLDAGGQDGNLHFGRACVNVASAVGFDDLGLGFFQNNASSCAALGGN